MASATRNVVVKFARISTTGKILQNNGSLTRCRRLMSSSAASVERWQVMSDVCVERYPVITTERSELENRFAKHLKTIEFQSSLLADHELHQKLDVEMADKRHHDGDQDHDVNVTRMTAQEREDSWDAEFNKFKPANRVTEADEKGDTQSTERKLDQKLILIVKQKLGDTSKWALPQGAHQDGESMRQTAERVLQGQCGDSLGAKFLSNAPCGFYKYKFPHKEQKCDEGAKVFFFKAHHQTGNVNLNNPDTTDYKWVTKSELSQYLNETYAKNIKQFILEF